MLPKPQKSSTIGYCLSELTPGRIKMKTSFILFTSLFVFCLINSGFSYKKISTDEAGLLLEQKHARFLFIGTETESKKISVPGAIPLTIEDVKYRQYNYLKGRDYVVVISAPTLSEAEEAGAILERKNFKKVYILPASQEKSESDKNIDIPTNDSKSDSTDKKIIKPSSLKNIPPLNLYTFSPETSTIIKGLEVEKRSSDAFREDETIGDLGLAALFYQNGCYTSGTYNHNDFKVEKGFIKDNENRKFDAYRIYPPDHKATKFLASRHGVYFRFSERTDYTIYELDGTKVEKKYTIPSQDIIPGKFIQIKDMEVSTLTSPRTYFAVPAQTRISSFSELSPHTEGAQIQTFASGRLLKFKYPVNARLSSITQSPHIRNYFPVSLTGSSPAMIYQDTVNKRSYITTMKTDLSFNNTIALPYIPQSTLVAATGDDKGNIYLAYVKKVSGYQEDKLVILKSDSQGKELRRNNPDTSQSALNIWDPGDYPASLRYSNGKLALLIARRMFRGGDGLNHQGGIAVVFDAETLKVVINTGQTSGHSFDNYLTVDSKGDFIAIDLGDNYPRGINLHRFFDQRRTSKVVYTFKTLHGTTPKSPAGKTYPAYPEISTATKQFYKWSNDNGTYTELGAVLETDDAYIVIFAGEPSPDGRSIDNSRTGGEFKDPRNLGYVIVRKDFENASGKANIISDDLVLSKGKEEKGGFYSFGGGWSEQRNKGVNWLTQYSSLQKGSVKRVKAAILDNKDICIFYELYSDKNNAVDYENTYMLIIDQKGKIKSGPTALSSHVRLSPRDDLLVSGNRVFIPSADPIEQKIEWIVWEAK